MVKSALTFTQIDTPIDYFSLYENYFPQKDFNVEKERIKFTDSEPYLEKDKHLASLDLERTETVVLNLQVGKGKSETIIKLVKEYYDKGYYVFVVAPFIKLIKKYQEDIINVFPEETVRNSLAITLDSTVVETGRAKIFHLDNYSSLDIYGNDLAISSGPFEQRIHLMTANLLLGNPGNELSDQNIFKKEYLKLLLKATKNEKVVLFLDEIHEATHNFKSHLIPNLLRWRNRISKVYVASATFTPATIPVIKAVSLLTDKKIKIYESKREKNKVQSSIYLRLFQAPYNAKSIAFINEIEKLATGYKNRDIPVNIITGTKSMAESLATSCFKNVVTDSKDLKEHYDRDSINLLTGDTDLSYQQKQNNIGTTFITGVNIIKQSQPLIIIIPTLTQEPMYSHYGVFQSGITAILQAIGRHRAGGDIHVFTYFNTQAIGDNDDYPKELQITELFPYKPVNLLYSLIARLYLTRVSSYKKQISFLEKEIINHSETLPIEYKKYFGFWFPNIHEYVIRHSNEFALKTKNISFGRLLSPYLLWACLNNQFANATLKEIIQYTSEHKVKLTDKHAYRSFITLLKPQKSKIKSGQFRNNLNNLRSLLSNHHKGGSIERVLYQVDNKTYSAAQLVNKQPFFMQQAIRALFFIQNGVNFPFNDKVFYINTCMKQAAANSSSENNSELQALYTNLNFLKEEFKKQFEELLIKKDGKFFIKNDAYEQIDDALIENIKAVIQDIKKNDMVLSSKAISFFQDINGTKPNIKKSVFNEFRSLTYMVKGDKKIDKQLYREVEILKDSPDEVPAML